MTFSVVYTAVGCVSSHPLDNQEPILAKDGPSTYHSPLHTLKRWHWWLLVALNIFFLIVGQAAAVLLGRFYYGKGGNSRRIATEDKQDNDPIFFVPPSNESSSTLSPRSVLILVAIYFILGALIAGDNMLYSIGLLYLSASTYSLNCATQLACNVVFSYILNHQKFTALILNSIIVLSLSSALLAVNDDSDKPSRVSQGKYIEGIITALAASALYSLLLSLMQLTFEKVLKKETFSVILEMQLPQSWVFLRVVNGGL